MSAETLSSMARADLLFLFYVQKKNLEILDRVMDTTRQPLHDRLLGCMLGLTAGDVVGCPVEGMTYSDIRARYDSVDGVLYPPLWRHWRLPGLHSDDTQQALAIVESVRQAFSQGRGRIEQSQYMDIAHSLATIYVEGAQADTQAPFGCWRGTGRGYRSVVERLAQPRSPGKERRGFLGLGSRIQNAQWPLGMGEPSAGVGAIMRIPPVGVLWSRDPSVISQISALLTLITHTDPLATISACAVAFACARLCSRTVATLDPNQFLKHLAQDVATLERHVHDLPGMETSMPVGSDQKPITSTLISLTRELIDVQPDEAMRRIGDETKSITGKRLHPTAGFAPPGVAASLYFFVHNVADPIASLTTAVNAGGDTDTIGAVVGALCGTLHGPHAYKQILPDLVALDLVLGKVGELMEPDAKTTLDLVEEESFLTKVETGMRRLLTKNR